MRCRDFNRLLNEIPYRDRSWAQRRHMDSHRSSCSRCAGVWQAEEMLRAIIVPPTPPTLLQRICVLIDEIVAGTVVPFPVRRTVIITTVVIAVAAAAAAGTLAVLDRIDGASVVDAAAPAVSEPAAPGDLPEAFAAEIIVIPAVEAASGSFSQDTAGEPEPATLVEADAASAAPAVMPASEPGPDPATGDTAPVEEFVAVVAYTPEAQPFDDDPPAATPLGTWDSLDRRLAIEELMAAPDPDAAARLGETLLQQTLADFGSPSREIAEIHLLLAGALRDLGDVVATQRHFQSAIEALGAAGVDPVQLIEPHIAFGSFYEAEGDYYAALEQYQSARQIMRSSQGVLTQDQIAIIDRMTHVNLLGGDHARARELQYESMLLVERTADPATEAAVEARFRYADWLRLYGPPESHAFQELVDLYEDTRVLIVTRFVDSDPALAIRLLQALAREMIEAGPSVAGQYAALEALRMSVRLANRFDDPRLIASVRRDAGDLFVLLSAGRNPGVPNSAAAAELNSVGGGVLSGGIPRSPVDYIPMAYERSWDHLGELEDGDAVRAEWFSGLTLLYSAPFQSSVVSMDPDAPRGRIVLEFTIDRRGQTRNIRVVESVPEGLLDSAMKNWLNQSLFRPRLTESGQTVPSRATIGMEFNYNPEAVDGSGAQRVSMN